MHLSDKKPTGTNVGYVRLQKRMGASFVQIVDFTRYELSPQCVRFREENWVATKDKVNASSRGRNTDDFHRAIWADEHFAWWLKTKLDDGYSILKIDGNPGPLPQRKGQ